MNIDHRDPYGEVYMGSTESKGKEVIEWGHVWGVGNDDEVGEGHDDDKVREGCGKREGFRRVE